VGWKPLKSIRGSIRGAKCELTLIAAAGGRSREPAFSVFLDPADFIDGRTTRAARS